MTIILHITSLAAWEEARAIGLYEAESLQAQGFIHFSSPEQCVRVADSFYRGQRGLVLLVVDTERLSSNLKWEAPIAPANSAEMNPTAGELFPHLYGPLNVDAVVKVLDFPLRDDDGTFALPQL